MERIAVDSGKVTIETIIPTGQDGIKLRNRRQDRLGQERGKEKALVPTRPDTRDSASGHSPLLEA